MKFAMNKKELLDKEKVGSKMEKSLKKTIDFLLENKGTKLPFYYQHGFIDDKQSFVSIGDAKEVHKEWKQRLKGKTTTGEKIDKKKVAQGEVYVDPETNIFKFEVAAGTMKPMEVKEAFKSIGIIKKKIKSNYEIIKGAIEEAADKVEGAVEAIKDVVTGGDSAETLIDAFKGFKQTEIANFAKKKDGANAQALISKGKAIVQKMEEFLASNDDKKVAKAKTVIEAKVNQVEAAIGKAQGKKAAGSLDKVTNDINSAIEDLLNNFASEVDGIGDTLKTTLNKLKK